MGSIEEGELPAGEPADGPPKDKASRPETAVRVVAVPGLCVFRYTTAHRWVVKTNGTISPQLCLGATEAVEKALAELDPGPGRDVVVICRCPDERGAVIFGLRTE